MKKTFITEDNQHGIPASDFSDIPALIEKISNKSLANLEDEGIFIFPNNLKHSKDLTDDLFVIKKLMVITVHPT